MSGEIIQRVINFVEGLIEKEIDEKEEEQISRFVEENIKFIETTNDIVKVAELAKSYLEFKEELDEDSGIKGEFDLVAFLQIPTFEKFVAEMNPTTRKKKAYLCLDSRYGRFNQERTKISWDIAGNLQVSENSTNLVGGVRDITSIRMHSIVVRKFPSVQQRASIFIEELAAQSFILPGGRRFHFMALLNDLQNPISIINRNANTVGEAIADFTVFDKYELLAGYRFNEGYYRFNKPVTLLDTVTVSIGNPDQLVVLPKYEFLDVPVINLTNNSLTLEFPEPHGYITNINNLAYNNYNAYSIFIDGFVSNEVNYNNFVNSYEFTGVTIVSPTVITLSFNDYPAGRHNLYPTANNIFPIVPALPISVRVRFNSYRILMNFELEYLG